MDPARLALAPRSREAGQASRSNERELLLSRIEMYAGRVGGKMVAEICAVSAIVHEVRCIDLATCVGRVGE